MKKTRERVAVISLAISMTIGGFILPTITQAAIFFLGFSR